MRLFIAYGYNERDRWVEEMVFPIAEAIGWTVAHGKVVYGGQLTQEVIELIASADALIGFTTRRIDRQGNLTTGTHEWVVKELEAACSNTPLVPFVEVREEGVSFSSDKLEVADFPRIAYRESARDSCLARVAEALAELAKRARLTTVKLSIGVAEDELGRLIQDKSFRLEFMKMDNESFREKGPFEAKVRRDGNTLFAKIPGVRHGELVRLSVVARGITWASAWEPVDMIKIELKEAK